MKRTLLIINIIKRAAPYPLIALFGAFVLLHPKECLTSAAAGVRICLDSVIPALFPFVFVSQLILETGVSDGLSIIFGRPLGRLLRLSQAAAQAMVLGFLGGYPVGARSAVLLYDDKKLTKDETERLLSCCNNCGPSFIFGVVGAGVFGSAAAAVLLWAVHILSAIAAGFILRGRRTAAKTEPGYSKRRRSVSFGAAFSKAGISSFQAMGNICAFVILFNVILLLPRWVGLYSISRDTIYRSLLSGVFELTNGVLSLSSDRGTAAFSCAAFLIGWGGLSVHFQTLSITAGRKLQMRRYFTGKILQAGISAAAAGAAAKVFMPGISETLYVFAGAYNLHITAYNVVLFSVPWLCLLLIAYLLGSGGRNSAN
ncbi:MAG: hypothetical protein GXX89_04910 [Clostridiales bacterium]|nr:hypothetical protein [Clostridiales bacterium]